MSGILPEKARRNIQSIEVGGSLLRALAEAESALTLTDLARRAGLPSAKAHPYLVSYANLGLIRQESTSGRYDFGPLALSIGLAALRRLNPMQIATAALPDLVETTGHTAALAIWGSHGPTVVYLHESTRPLHVNLRVGSVMSLKNTATGQIFAAWRAPGEVRTALAREGADINRSIGADALPLQALEAQQQQVRADGLAGTVDHPVPGISALSAPVFDHTGGLALAVTLLGPSGMFDARPQGCTAQTLRQFVAKISEELGKKA